MHWQWSCEYLLFTALDSVNWKGEKQSIGCKRMMFYRNTKQFFISSNQKVKSTKNHSSESLDSTMKELVTYQRLYLKLDQRWPMAITHFFRNNINRDDQTCCIQYLLLRFLAVNFNAQSFHGFFAFLVFVSCSLSSAQTRRLQGGKRKIPSTMS